MKLTHTLLLAIALALASFIPGSIGFCSHHCWERVRVSRSLGTKHQVPNWPCSLGLSSCPSWIPLRLITVVPAEGLRQQPVGTEHQPSDLPYPLGHFWDYFDQGRRVWMLCSKWEAICFLSMMLLAHGLWRKVKRCHRQVSDGDTESRKGPACGEQGSTKTLATKTYQERTQPSRHKEALAGPERPSASFPETHSATALTAAGSPWHGPGPAGGVVSPTYCSEQAFEAGCSRGSRAQQDNSPPSESSSMLFTVLLHLSLPGNRPVGLSFHGDRLLGKGCCR